MMLSSSVHNHDVMSHLKLLNEPTNVLVISDTPHFYKEIAIAAAKIGVRTTWAFNLQNIAEQLSQHEICIVDTNYPILEKVVKHLHPGNISVPVIFVATTPRMKRFAELAYQGKNPALFVERKIGVRRILDVALAFSRVREDHDFLETTVA